jgi:hypothetical protein
LTAKLPFDGKHVYISQYHDLTRGDDGAFCSEIRLLGAIIDAAVELVPSPMASFLSPEGVEEAKRAGVSTLLAGVDLTDGQISAQEVQWARDKVITPLNATVERAAAANGWVFVPGLAQALSTHGYCADEHWVVRYEESKSRQTNRDGTLHPNGAGHRVLADLLYERVSKDLGVAPPAPAPVDGGDAGADADREDAAGETAGADRGVDAAPEGPADPADAGADLAAVDAGDQS